MRRRWCDGEGGGFLRELVIQGGAGSMEAGGERAGRSYGRLGVYSGTQGVVTWINGECPRRDRRGSERRRYVCIKMRTQVNTPLFTYVHTPPHTVVDTPLPA